MLSETCLKKLWNGRFLDMHALHSIGTIQAVYTRTQCRMKNPFKVCCSTNVRFTSPKCLEIEKPGPDRTRDSKSSRSPTAVFPILPKLLPVVPLCITHNVILWGKGCGRHRPELELSPGTTPSHLAEEEVEPGVHEHLDLLAELLLDVLLRGAWRN